MRLTKSAQPISNKLNINIESYASVALAAGVTLWHWPLPQTARL